MVGPTNMPPLPGLEGTSCLHPLRRSGEGAVGGAGAGEDGGDGGVAGGTIGHGDRGLREKPGLPLEEGRSAMSVGFEELAHFRRERPDISAWIGVHAKRILCAMDEPTQFDLRRAWPCSVEPWLSRQGLNRGPHQPPTGCPIAPGNGAMISFAAQTRQKPTAKSP